MVKDSTTGLQLGSAIEKNVFVDATQFKNRSVRVTTRNTSGDRAYQMQDFVAELNAALARKGYSPTTADSFGLRIDLNVLYSGQIQTNMSSQYAFIGGVGGGVAGYRSGSRGALAGGALVGSTVGAIIGSNVTDDTYMVVAEISIGVVEGAPGDQRVITFGSSPPLQREISKEFTPFREVLRNRIAVYAGGRNVDQRMVVDEVRRRLASIVGDSI